MTLKGVVHLWTVSSASFKVVWVKNRKQATNDIVCVPLMLSFLHCSYVSSAKFSERLSQLHNAENLFDVNIKGNNKENI